METTTDTILRVIRERHPFMRDGYVYYRFNKSDHPVEHTPTTNQLRGKREAVESMVRSIVQILEDEDARR